jgi:hypothetical protein
MRKLLTGLAILLGSVSIVLAHHPFSSEYDANKPVTLTGTVSSVDWKIPHVNVKMDAPNDSGKNMTWTLEGASSATLESKGWKNTTIKTGDRITAKGYRALDGSTTVSARSVSLLRKTAVRSRKVRVPRRCRAQQVTQLRSDCWDWWL